MQKQKRRKKETARKLLIKPLTERFPNYIPPQAELPSGWWLMVRVGGPYYSMVGWGAPFSSYSSHPAALLFTWIE